MALGTAHKRPNTAIDTVHESRLVCMASCRIRCACGHQNSVPGTDARKKVVSGRGEADASTSGYVLLWELHSSVGIGYMLIYMSFRSNP
jgi:hypothetical protein